jgi:hypothetical protein
VGTALAQAQTRALESCRAGIEEARAAVFVADDGVIPARMTELEREWRRLSRSDPDGGLMDLWARIAPTAWLDRKRWRHSNPSGMLDTAVALAADVEGVDAAEAAVRSFGSALAAWGAPIGLLVRWRPLEADTDGVSPLLAQPLLAATEAVAQLHQGPRMLELARELERAVHAAAMGRFPGRPLLAQALARAALLDRLLHAAAILERPNPVTPLRELWHAGYTLAAGDATGVTLEFPPLT